MSNWTSITTDDLKSAAHGTLIDKARTTATGNADPLEEEISNAVARVRRAVATGNALDVDPAKIPNSLKAVTVRIAVYALMERLRFPLSDDQRDTRKADQSDLLRIADKKTLVESPDMAAGSGEMQRFGGVVAVNVPRRMTGRERTSGL